MYLCINETENDNFLLQHQDSEHYIRDYSERKFCKLNTIQVVSQDGTRLPRTQTRPYLFQWTGLSCTRSLRALGQVRHQYIST